MAEIMTVCGPITPEQLGFTSMHEHTLYDGSCFRRRFEAFIPADPPVRLDEPIRLDNLGMLKHGFIMSRDAFFMNDEPLMAAELADFKAVGGGAVVDMSTPGLRLDPLALRRVSQASGVHIIATTGLYSRDSWPERFLGMGIDDMIAYMRREVGEGLDGTGILPGHVKVAIEEDFCEPEVNALRAGARVARESGLSLTVHQGMLLGPEAGAKIADILESEGMPFDRTVIAHNDGKFVTRDLTRLILKPDAARINVDTAMRLLDRGLNLSIDTFGHYWDAESVGIVALADWERLAGLVALLRAGYAAQLVLGTDTFIKFLLRRYGGEGYGRLCSFVVPTLERVGVAREDIQRLTVDNPARLLAKL
jgi:phosphotriesterase-related protein